MMLGFVSCVEDKGNYSYSDINEIFVDLPKDYARVYLEDTVVRIEPRLTQSLAKDESNLSFIWKHSNVTHYMANREGDTVSTQRYVNQTISSTDMEYFHYYWLEITDKTTGLVYPFYTTLTVVKPFVNAWTILHTQENNAKLGAIEYILKGDPEKHLDIFGEFGYPPLRGNAVALGANNEDQASLQGGAYPSSVYNAVYLITTDADESGVYAPWSKFNKYVPGVGIPQMVYNYNSSYFDVSKVTSPYKANGDGGIVVNDGRLFHGRSGLKWYEAKKAAAVGDIHVDKILRVGRISIIYDDLGKRFLWYNHAGNGSAPAGSGKYAYTVGNFHDDENKSEIQEMDRTSNSISLKNIEHRVLHIGIGYKTSAGYQYVKSYAIANSQSEAKTYIYMFPTTYVIAQSSSNKSIEELKVINTPAGLNENSCFASGIAYNNIAFYSSGSSVYRLDFSTGIATKIYDHSSGGTIVKMTMAKQELSSTNTYDTEAYGFPFLERSLGIAVNRGASGELAVLNLNEAGSVIATSVFDGFGNIKDICFVSDIKR
jgi:hypothetical protein